MHKPAPSPTPASRRRRPATPAVNAAQPQAALAETATPPVSREPAVFQALLADDNALFRNFLRNVLIRHFPFMVIAEASNGGRAVALDAELHPQLIFMDIKLPDCNGLDLTRQIKSSNPEVLIYLVTPYDIPEYRVAAIECGADHVIVKGESNEAAIVAMVEATLSGQLQESLLDDNEELQVSEAYEPDLQD